MIQLSLIMRLLFFHLKLAKLSSSSKKISDRNLAKINTDEFLADLKKHYLSHNPSS